MLSNLIADAINVQTTINSIIIHITQVFGVYVFQFFINNFAQWSKYKPV